MVCYIPNLINQLIILCLSQHRPFLDKKIQKEKRNTTITEHLNYEKKSLLFQCDTQLL